MVAPGGWVEGWWGEEGGAVMKGSDVLDSECV